MAHASVKGRNNGNLNHGNRCWLDMKTWWKYKKNGMT